MKVLPLTAVIGAFIHRHIRTRYHGSNGTTRRHRRLHFGSTLLYLFTCKERLSGGQLDVRHLLQTNRSTLSAFLILFPGWNILMGMFLFCTFRLRNREVHKLECHYYPKR
jgi:hypothetical protein